MEVKPFKNGALCPRCNRRGKNVHTVGTPRIWRDLPVCGRQVFFIYSPREIICRTHGRMQEFIPWADLYSRVTHRFEYALLVYCSTMTQKAAAQFLKISQSALSDLLHRIITRTRQDHKVRNLRSIGVDEISYCKGHKYATIVYDLEKSCVVWIGKGKARDTIDTRKALKRLRWLLYRHSSNRTEEDTKSLRSLYRGNRRIHRAWILKDEFE